MRLQGYTAVDVTPWENASAGKAIDCAQPQGCWASFRFTRDAGQYILDVLYFDQKNGESQFRVFVNDKLVDQWRANDQLPSIKIGADSATRRRLAAITLHPGDEIRIEGIPDGDEHAALDYVELTPTPK
jgi:alpha-glucuronidase